MLRSFHARAWMKSGNTGFPSTGKRFGWNAAEILVFLCEYKMGDDGDDCQRQPSDGYPGILFRLILQSATGRLCGCEESLQPQASEPYLPPAGFRGLHCVLDERPCAYAWTDG